MNIPRQTIIRAVKTALFCSLFLIAVDRGFGQSGPPPLPLAPVNALVAYPLSIPPWNDWYGDPARGFTNLNVVGGSDSNGGASLSVDTNVPAYLNYDVYQDGYTNMVFDAGSFSLWCQANWTSITDGGTGPTNWAVLFSVGNWTSNAAQSAWTLAISPEGTNLVMEAQAGGSNQTVFNVPIDFDAGDWHSVTVTYCSTNCCLFLEGQFVTNVEPISNMPSNSDCTNYGMFVGSLSTAGLCQFHGQFQWLDTYDYPLSANEVASDYAEVSSYLAYYGGSLPPVGVGAGGGFHTTDDGPPVFPGGGGGSTNGGGSGDDALYTPFTPPAAISPINYAAYDDFYLSITNNATNSYVNVCNCLSNITYEILTNANLANSNGWQVWQTLLATNSTTPAPPIALSITNALYFKGLMVWSTCTSFTPPLPDWWAMLYFNSTACVNPAANPSGDGIDNWDKYLLGLNPNVAYVSQLLVQPPGGNYVVTPSISVFSLSGASITYTTNGSLPSATNGFTTASGVPLTNVPGGNFTLKAWESGLVSNVPAVAAYTIIPATPVFSLAEGVYAYGTELHISSVTTTAVVRYTTNESTPTTNSLQIEPANVVALVSNETIEAAAWVGTNVSPVASAAYIIEAALPTNPPPNDDFSNAITISGTSGTIVGTTLNATLEPFETNPIYSSYDQDAAGDGNSVWYKWVAPSNGAVYLDCYEFHLDLSAWTLPAGASLNPTNLVPSGLENGEGSGASWANGIEYYTMTVTQGVSYYISASIYYYYSGPFEISWQYVGPVAMPIFWPDAGTYLSNQVVTVSDNDTNAIIYYTLNGSSPTTNDVVIASGASLTISSNTTLNAAAWRAGLEESAVKSAVYTINASSTNPTLTASAPALSPGNTNFASSLTITLTCTNAGAVVYYTMDGSIPTSASASVSNGGTVMLTNSTLFNASAWVTNMNFSPITTGWYAKNGVDTTGDGILDSVALAIGADPFISDANAVNPNPSAHGLNNMQVSQNQSVLIANNYSTLNDGVPDWWLVQNGYSVNTSANTLGNNGQTLLASYTAGLNPNSPGSQPGQLPPIDFHIIVGQSNNAILVLDNVGSNIIDYILRCTDVDPASPDYNQVIQEKIPANTSVSVAGQPFGRYFTLPIPLPNGTWTSQLFGLDALQRQSKTTTGWSAQYGQEASWTSPPTEITTYDLLTNAPTVIVQYTNKGALKEQILAQELRSSSVFWQDNLFANATLGGYLDVTPPLIYSSRAQPLVTTNYWGVGQFGYDDVGNLECVGLCDYFTNFCATSNSYAECPSSPANAYYNPLYTETDANGNLLLVMSYNDDQYGSNWLINPFGLECQSVGVRVNNETPVVLSPGASMPAPTPSDTWEVAQNLETPVFHTVNYYYETRNGVREDGYAYFFNQSLPPWGFYSTALPGWDSLYYPDPGADTIPVPVTNPVVVAQVGRPITLVTWRNVMAYRSNGDAATNETFWIEQDLDQAYLCDPTTGDVPRLPQTNALGQFLIDTNNAVTTGFLSPDCASGNLGDGTERPAQFTPTQGGKVILTTKPGLDGDYGQLTIYVIDMQVDANHDGVMDNRDLTSSDNPMQFWVNNDVDRWHSIDYGTDEEQDDLETNGEVLDCNYQNGIGQYAIPCTRDLEDYARLWIPGLTNLMQVLPSGYGITLQWRNGTGAGIRIFGAADADGGTNYLFNGTIASNQVDTGWYPCFGYVTSNQPLVANYTAWQNLNGYLPSDHFIFCGTSSGNDELVLQVTNQYGGEVGEASVFLNLKDIKQMYERWTVGDDSSVAPTSIAIPAYDGLPPGVGSFQYPYDSQTDINTPYILHVHGSNMELWEKDRFAETMYKRLYWQGYQGRFGSFRWPTSSGYNPVLSPPSEAFFGEIEDTAWLSAPGLKNLLTRLNILYPGQVQLSAHSMGNIAAGEALRQATSTLVQTYAAFQGSVPAHDYDTNAPTLTVSPDAGEPNVYAHYWNATNAQYFAGAIGAANYVNFFNTNDFVLDHWLAYQPDKPVSYYDYGYTSGNYWQVVSGNYDYLHFPTNTYQIFSFCQQAKCNCIGEQGNLGGQFAPLGKPKQVDLAGPPYNYQDTHKYHSGEFRSDNMSRASFWDQVLVQMGLK